MGEDDINPVTCFWDSFVHHITPASYTKRCARKAKQNTAAKSIYRCHSDDKDKPTFWFCNNAVSTANRAPAQATRKRGKKVQFSSKFNVVLIEPISRSLA
ncbi:hypothetical protein TRVL_00758 [Trypanosoma vivax]|nr:hypothetical protein TRVL_00758 [Trypanosoma vivax]